MLVDQSHIPGNGHYSLSEKRRHAGTSRRNASTRTTQLYDRRRDELTLDEVERILFSLTPSFCAGGCSTARPPGRLGVTGRSSRPLRVLTTFLSLSGTTPHSAPRPPQPPTGARSGGSREQCVAPVPLGPRAVDVWAQGGRHDSQKTSFCTVAFPPQSTMPVSCKMDRYGVLADNPLPSRIAAGGLHAGTGDGRDAAHLRAHAQCL